MLTKRIIPCLDVDNGRVVKGLNFESIKDAGDPVELASKYSRDGADELVFLDITASQQKRKTIKELVSSVARVIDIPFTVGGGVNSMDDARNILLSGADKVGINTGAVKNPTLLADLMDVFGRQCIVIAIDAKRNYSVDGGDPAKTIFEEEDEKEGGGGGGEDDGDGRKFWFEVFIYGGKKGTGLDAIQWAKKATELGAGEVLLTSIDRDGTKDGYDVLLTKKIVEAVSVPVIASGGCGKPEDMYEIFDKSDADAALAASIFHYEDKSVDRVKKVLQGKNIPVRI